MFTTELLGYGHRATLLASPVHSVLKKPAPKLLDMLKPTDCFSWWSSTIQWLQFILKNLSGGLYIFTPTPSIYYLLHPPIKKWFWTITSNTWIHLYFSSAKYFITYLQPSLTTPPSLFQLIRDTLLSVSAAVMQCKKVLNIQTQKGPSPFYSSCTNTGLTQTESYAS